jgi:hypothetical protein
LSRFFALLGRIRSRNCCIQIRASRNGCTLLGQRKILGYPILEQHL